MKKLIFGLVIAAVATACGSTAEPVSSVSGKYMITFANDVEGTPAEDGEFIVSTLIAKDNNDSTRFNIDPFVARKDTALWNNGKAGFYEILMDVNEGDSIITTVEVNMFFEETAQSPAPPWVVTDNVTDLTFYIAVEKILPMDSMQAYMEKREEEKVKEEMGDAYVAPEDQPKKDEELILAYLEEKGLEAQKDSSGVYYVITQEGEGETLTSGTSVDVNYAGYLLNGNYFDTSWEEIAKEKGLYNPGRPYQPFNIVIDRSSLIEGWHIGFKLLKKGSKATLFIPSALGYGRRANGDKIPANSVLVFDVEVVEVK